VATRISISPLSSIDRVFSKSGATWMFEPLRTHAWD
jgi:hypothetical protein